MTPGPADRRDLVPLAADPDACPGTPIRPRPPNTTDPNGPMALNDFVHPHDPEAPTPEHPRTDDGGEAG
jgi:hypothetical protein